MRIFYLLILSLISVCFFSCKVDPADIGTLEEVDIIGKWVPQKVTGRTQVFGAPASDTDENPSGSLEFFDDNTGRIQLTFTLFDYTLTDDELITWELQDSMLIIVEEDNVVQEWRLLDTNNDFMRAEYARNIANIIDGFIEAEMIRE